MRGPILVRFFVFFQRIRGPNLAIFSDAGSDDLITLDGSPERVFLGDLRLRLSQASVEAFLREEILELSGGGRCWAVLGLHHLVSRSFPCQSPQYFFFKRLADYNNVGIESSNCKSEGASPALSPTPQDARYHEKACLNRADQQEDVGRNCPGVDKTCDKPFDVWR